MIEILLCAAIALYLATQTELRALGRRLGTGHRVFSVALLGAILLGQLADDGKRSFPFVTWDMYAQRALGDPLFHRYQLVRASGRRDPLSGFGPDRRLSPQMHQRLQALARGSVDAGDDGAAAGAVLDDTLRELARAHARDVSGDPPVSVEIWRATVQLHDPDHPGEVRQELVRRVELP